MIDWTIVKHRVDRDLNAVKRRINCTVDELKKLAEKGRNIGGCVDCKAFRQYSTSFW